MEAALPPHSQEVVVSRMDWAESECTLDVDFGHECPLAQLHDGMESVAS